MVISALVLLYASHVIKGKRSIDMVSLSIREQVKERIEEMNKSVPE